jgi:uncharacterized repeat protein (TIGR01451 family)
MDKPNARLIYTAAALAVLAGAGSATAQQGWPSQNPTANRNIRVAAATPVVPLKRGEKWTVPLSGVTRVVPADDDVARGSFVDGKAVVEGVTTGSTLVEVYQGNNQRQLYTIQVADTRLAAATPSNVPPAPGDTVSPISSTTGVVNGRPVTVTSNTPVVVAATPPSSAALPASSDNGLSGIPTRANLKVSLRYSQAADNPSHSVFTITFANQSSVPAQGVVVRSALDDVVSYVTGSATGGARYDSSSRELIWNIGNLEAGATGRTVSFRVEPIERTATTFYTVATIEDASGTSVSSNALKVGTQTMPLLTVFALPDRFLAGRNAQPLLDVKGAEYQNAIYRLQTMGVIDGRGPNSYQPNDAARRAEYAVMTLKGLHLRDLRDVTAIKFVLGRASTVSLEIFNSSGKLVHSLLQSRNFEAGERTAIWDGRTATGYAPPGRYRYVCTARDDKRETTKLEGNLTIVPQTPFEPSGRPSYSDVKPTDWYAGHLAMAEKQNLMIGYPDKTFRPNSPISRVEATAVVVRALGLEELAKQSKNQSVGFLDYQNIPAWAMGYVNVASTIAKSRTGKLIVGYPSNFFLPLKSLRRDEAALIAQRFIDKETNRRVSVSGQLAPGATVTINSQTVEANDQGQFSFVIEQNTAEPTTLTVLGNTR